MDTSPIPPAMLERIKRKERRRKAVRERGQVDWRAVSRSTSWVALPLVLDDDSHEEWMREFYRLRQQAAAWSKANGILIAIRRDSETRTIFAGAL